ncbi:MAG: iron ABC transporter permease, partial [Desulfitobacteriaceae bacterium]|nr:iron ABC transporter permease [Desulfitobacteriaceae bacterium]
MKRVQSSKLDRKKFFSDPILICTILLLFAFLILFILYPLAVLLIDSVYVPEDGGLVLSVFRRILNMSRFRTAFANTLKLGLLTGLFSTLIGLLFAYVDVYMRVQTKGLEKLFNVVSLLPVVSPPFVLSLSTIMLFGRSGIIT